MQVIATIAPGSSVNLSVPYQFRYDAKLWRVYTVYTCEGCDVRTIPKQGFPEQKLFPTLFKHLIYKILECGGLVPFKNPSRCHAFIA